jgi:hypothetical protein
VHIGIMSRPAPSCRFVAFGIQFRINYFQRFDFDNMVAFAGNVWIGDAFMDLFSSESTLWTGSSGHRNSLQTGDAKSL